MFAVGHLALGYIFAKAFQKITKTEINLPTIFLLSLIPDADFFIPGSWHRTATHSMIALTLIFTPAFLYYRKNSLPYFAAITQHALVGDLLTNGGIQMLWPLSFSEFGLGIAMRGSMNISIEWLSFLLSIALLVLTNDLKKLLSVGKSSLLLAVPAGAIFLSSIIGKRELAPTELLIPHLVFLAMFAFSMMRFVFTTELQERASRLTPRR